MTDRTEGDYLPTDHDDLAEWLRSIRREDTIETAFRENASTLVGWFCLLLDQVEALHNENEELHARFTGPDEECDDPRCAFCWPSYTCSSECDHEWIVWDDDDPNAWSFCAQCGIREENDNVVVIDDEYEDYCPANDWAHDWIDLGDFRAENGELIFRGGGRRICKACAKVTPPETPQEPQSQEYLSADGPNIEPLDNGPELLDPAVCEHEGWTTFSTGYSRCKGCATWMDPLDDCPFGSHDPVAIGVKGRDPMFVCSLCHKEFDGKPPKSPAKAPAPVTPPEPTVVLPEPVAHVARKPEECIFIDARTGDEEVKQMVRGEIKIGPSEDATCPECGWSDPHSHVTVDGTINHPANAIPLPMRTPPKAEPTDTVIPAWDPTLYDHIMGCTNRKIRFYNTGGCDCPAYRPGHTDEEETALTEEGMSSTQRALVAAAMVWHGYADR